MMGFLKRILPGFERPCPIDLTDANEKLQQEREELNDIHRRAERLEPIWFNDALFPETPRKDRTNARIL